MKYLSDYTEELQDIAFKKYGAFFAFGNTQFEEKRVKDIVYVNMGSGLICPKENAHKLADELDSISEQGRKQDLEENGKEGVIERELSNYECYYVGDISDAVDALISYGITEDEVRAVYRKTRDNHE